MSDPQDLQPELVVTAAAGGVRSSLEPVAWLVLEELALRATIVHGLVVAEDSSRSLAVALGRSKDSVSRALRLVVEAGLVEHVAERDLRSGQYRSGRYLLDLRAAGLRRDDHPLPLVPAPPAEQAPPQRPARAARSRIDTDSLF